MRPAAFVLALLFAPAAAGAGPLPEATARAIDGLLDKAVAEGELPSLAVAVSIPGRGDYLAARGPAALGGDVARAPGDPFRIGSVTKTFIATAVLQLAAEGALALDDPVSTWFPGFPDGDAIRVDDLLRMRSGLFDAWTDAELEAFYADPLHAPSADAMIARTAAGDRAAPPDRETVYNNTNYLMLDHIVASVAGQPTGAVLQARLLAPLGLADTAMPTGTELPGRLRGYGRDPASGRYQDKTELDPAPVAGAGAMVSTLPDLSRWVRALCTGELLTSEAQAARMRTDGFAGSPDWVRYGQGVAMFGPFCGHNGTIMGFSTDSWYLPAHDATIVVSVSRLDADDRSWSSRIFRDLATALFPGEVPW